MTSFTQLSLLLLTLCSVACEYRNKIEPFSFDIQKFEYPLEYLKMGTAVALRDVIKLIPKVENRYGGLFMSQVSLIFCFHLIHFGFDYSLLRLHPLR